MKTETQSYWKIYLLMLFVPLFWGGTFPAAQHVITEIPPITAAAIRFGTAGLILLFISLYRSEWNFKEIKQRWAGLLLMALTGIFAYNTFFFFALNYTSAINGSLIMATTPVFMTLGAVLFLKEPWHLRLGIGLLLSLTGVLLVVTQGSQRTLLSLSFNVGDLLFIMALVSWVVHGLIGKVVMRGTPPLLTTTFTTIVGSVGLFIWSVFEGGWKSVPLMSVQAWLEMMYMIIFATVAAFFLWNKGVHDIGASQASMFMNLVPINASWIAVALYGSTITWKQMIGMLMVITSVFLVAVSTNIHSPEKEPKKLTSA
ncbi:drug/metabolite transporter (DMT)-like permease [Caldalkalibacillus uzonensis]|uniref:Drug/metabolite transporter (DMT)-like permease n=1 Tax=Caldalkalibacillus uzonensis TaxID=353224 RepID=A0ABU0CWB8_9BACI|nr:DMT family transporter [Caldalkalibacillus uzonensis]MDQ0340701.1 drug/metabolite transporter (DMT)-like permease [Caldalkalibacillus uzonensis]